MWQPFYIQLAAFYIQHFIYSFVAVPTAMYQNAKGAPGSKKVGLKQPPRKVSCEVGKERGSTILGAEGSRSKKRTRTEGQQEMLCAVSGKKFAKVKITS